MPQTLTDHRSHRNQTFSYTCPRFQSFSRPSTSITSSIPRMGRSRNSSLAIPNTMWPSFFMFKNPQFGVSVSSASVALKSPHFVLIFLARVKTWKQENKKIFLLQNWVTLYRKKRKRGRERKKRRAFTQPLPTSAPTPHPPPLPRPHLAVYFPARSLLFAPSLLS